MFDEYEDIMLVPDVQEALQVGRNRVYQLVQEGSIKAIRLGKGWRIPKKSVIDFVMTQAGLNK